jgi:hypothetical protein
LQYLVAPADEASRNGSRLGRELVVPMLMNGAKGLV